MDRLTQRTIGAFKYDLKNCKHEPKEFNNYHTFYAYSNAVKRLGELEDKEEPRQVIKIKGISSQACPVCGKNVNNKYCGNCGQKLKY